MRFVAALYVLALLFGPIGLSFSEAEAEIRSDTPKTITAIIQSDSPPTYFKDRITGKAAGFAVDVMNGIAKRGGLTVVYQFEKNWDAIAPLIRSGKVDVAPGQGITENRKEIAAFTSPIGTFPVSIFARAKDNGITGVNDVRTIGITKGSSSSEVLKKKYPDITITVYDSNAHGLMDLLSGRIDAFCTSFVTFTRIALEAGLEDKIITIGEPLSEVKRAIAVHKGDPELLNTLDRLIDEFIHTPEYKEIYRTWYGKPQPYWTVRKVLIITSLLVLFTVICMALWRYRSIALLNRDLRQNINDRKKAEEALMESEQRFRHLSDDSPLAILIVNRNGNIEYVNKKCSSIMGYASGEIPTLQHWWSLVYPDKAFREIIIKEWAALVEKVSAGEEIKNKQRRIVCKDGSAKDVELRISQIEDKIIVIFDDISERRATETLILKAKEDWEETFNTITEAITVHDNDFNIIKSNRAAEELLGLPFADIKKPKCYEHYHGSGFPPEDCPSCKVLQTARPSVTELFEPHLKKHLEIKALPRLARDGSLIGLIHVVRDISERKKAEEALLEHEIFSKNLIQNSATATFVLDRTHRIMRWNKACEELTGCSESEMIGTDGQWRPFYDHKRPTVADVIIDGDTGSLPALYQTYATSSLNPQGITAEGWYKNLGGKDRYIIFEAAPIFSGKGELIAAIETLEDITERKRLEEQLRQSQKLEAIGQLAGGVAHDFNNIITAVVGYSHLTLMKMEKDNPLRVNIEQILQASDKATTLTQSLLAFSRKQVINPKPDNLNDIVSGLHKLLLRLIREDIEITIQCAKEELMIMADRGQIEQVLMNLVTNARDAMPKGGSIMIQAEHIHLPEDIIETNGHRTAGKYALLRISDTGLGMDAKTTERIFEPFFTTKEQGKGTGLGLSMVYGIVSQHDGTIDVSSEVGKGTTFSIYLPIFRGALQGELEPVEISPLKGGSEMILIAEDDLTIREMSSMILSNYGYSVVEAVDGEDAIVKYAKHRDSIKLVILDAIMPKKNGKEAYQEIRIITPSIKTLFISGYAEDILSREGKLEPRINFILKPVTPSVLLKTVRYLLDA